MSYIKPFETTTTNIKNALQAFITLHKILPERVTFDILAYNTFYRIAPAKEWIKIDPTIRKKILHKKNLANTSLKFVEQYKIRIYEQTAKKPLQTHLSLQSTKLKTKIFVLCKKELLMQTEHLSTADMIQEIQRKLVLAGFLLGLFTTDIEKAVHLLFLELKAKKSTDEDLNILISHALTPKNHIPENLISHYLLKGEDPKRAYESGVDASELIAEYHMPQMGNNGRDCKGNFLEAQGKPIKECSLILYDPQTIKVAYDADRIRYYALKKGFVNFNEQSLAISNELQLELASFKTTGSITIGGHRDIDLTINQADLSKDALDRGVSIDVSNVAIKGSIADNTSIKADKVSIDSYTHKTSTIEAGEEAKVYLHRGNLKAHKATIEKLEFGLVEADVVNVKEVLGGEIRAREIYIETLHSNAKLIASDIIQIKKIRGKHNTFIIAPDKIESLDKHVKQMQVELKESKHKLQLLNKELERLLSKIEREYGTINMEQKQVATAVRQGRELPVLAATRVRQHGIDKQKSEELAVEIQQAHAHVDSLQTALAQSEHALQEAKIIYNDYWDGTQEIFYEHSNATTVEKVIPEGFYKEIIYKNLDVADLIKVNE